jgi:hypothetical protein
VSAGDEQAVARSTVEIHPPRRGRLVGINDELLPAERARIVQLLVERVDVRMHGVEVRLRPNGIGGLVREVAGSSRRAA